MNTQTQIPFHLTTDDKKRITLVAASGAGSLALSSTQVQAQTAPTEVTTAVSTINATLVALGGLAVTALGVVLIPMGIRYALKYAKQVASKS